MKNNKILVILLISICYIVYGSNQVFAGTCANGRDSCNMGGSRWDIRAALTNAEVDYFSSVGVNYSLGTLNNLRKPYADCLHCHDSSYKFSDHVVDDVDFRSDGIRLHCVNAVGRNLLLPGSSTCKHYSWDCRWTDCKEDGEWQDCKNTCTQRWQCTMVSTEGSCPGTSAGADPSYDVKKDLTQTGCTQSPMCGSADGYIYEPSDNNWLGKTLCSIGNPLPNDPDLPTINSTVTNWQCKEGSDTVSCSASMRTKIVENTCGDGIVQKPNNQGVYELCDDGNNNNNDSCPNSCVFGLLNYCGNGIKESGEDCDDGNNNDYDTCPNSCKKVLTIEYCGDGIKQTLNSFNLREECDDGNNLGGDGCSSTCTLIGGGYCGDGIVGGSETCDDGNNNSNDGCTNNCTLPHTSHPGDKKYCGNGREDRPNYFGFNEECDDGNTINDDLCSNNCTQQPTGLPGEVTIGATTSCNLSNNAGYANNRETNSIYANITVVQGVEDNKDVINFGTPTDFVDLSNNLSDRVYNKGNSSLHFIGEEINWIPGNGNTQTVKIATVTSVTPFASCGNKISFKLGGKTMVLNDVGYNFKKPFIGELTSTGKISLGTKLTYKISAIPLSTFSNYAIGLKVNNIKYYGDNITLQNTKLLNYPGTLERKFETRINSSNNSTKINNKPGIQVVLPVISYTAPNGQVVRYYLSAYDYGNDRTPITMSGNNFIGIKIIGGLQGAGKYEFTGQGKNISNLYPSDLRTQIRSRAYEYTKNMTNGRVINKVKYVSNEDITLSGSLGYETLVVKNGNVIIEGDLNTENKKLGIIVLKDNYDINNGYNGAGNILVKPNVSKINAIIYADGGFLSADEEGKVYSKDSTDRTYGLQRQLTMNGVLFTRNTIGGAQYGGTKNSGIYILPGGSKTLSFDKAMVYDLNYIRRGNIGCEDKDGNGNCDDANLGEIKEGFIIKYDSRIQTSPPRLFSN